MPIRKLFYDANGNNLECYINSNGGVFLQVGDKDTEDIYKGCIELNKEDVKELIQVLRELEEEVKS